MSAGRLVVAGWTEGADAEADVDADEGRQAAPPRWEFRSESGFQGQEAACSASAWLATLGRFSDNKLLARIYEEDSCLYAESNTQSADKRK